MIKYLIFLNIYSKLKKLKNKDMGILLDKIVKTHGGKVVNSLVSNYFAMN